MGYTDAIEDGIVFDENGRRFYIPCEICGRKIIRTQYSRKRTYICDYCKGLIKKKEKASIPKELENVETKREKQFRRAVEKIKAQVKDYDKYERPIELAKTRAELYGSVPETMVAIELLKIGYKIIPQQKIKKYRVDFAIPREKIIVEVDGSIYHRDRYKGDREAIIQLALGLDWKIIHIPAELIEKDITKLKSVIETFYKR